MMVSIVDSATFKLNIGTANTNSYNLVLWNLFTAQYPYIGTGVNVEFTLLGNIGSTSTSTYSLQTGTWPVGSNIKLIVPATSGGTANSPANGIIAGKGGDAVFTGCCDNLSAAQNPGGPAILLSYPLAIVNSGIIGSGGTGGLGITQDRDHPNPGDGGGGAGIDVGYSQARGRNYNGAAVYSSYLIGGASTGIGAGNLGQPNGAGLATAKAIVTQGNTLTVTGNGQLLGGTS